MPQPAHSKGPPVWLDMDQQALDDAYDQTRDFHAAVTAAGKPATLIVGEACNHFELLETLANPYGLLGRAALEQMGLSPSLGRTGS